MATCTPPAQTCAGHHNSSAVSAALINRPQNSRNIDVGSCEFVSCGCESAHRPMCRSVGVGHRSSPPISHVIRWSDKLTTLRKPQNSNDVDSKFERVAGELRAKLRWGVVLHQVSGCQGFGVQGIPGCQGFWVLGIPRWQRFVSQSKLQADGPQATGCQGFGS